MAPPLRGQPPSMGDDIHTKSTTVDDSDPAKASGEVSSDSVGKQTGPAATGDTDHQAVERGREDLDRASGGH